MIIMEEQLSPYKKASKAYFQIMSSVVFFLCAYFVYKMNAQGGSAKEPFFWIMVIFSCIALFGFFMAGRVVSKYGDQHYDPTMQKWDFYTLPPFIALLLALIIPPILENSTNLDQRFGSGVSRLSGLDWRSRGVSLLGTGRGGHRVLARPGHRVCRSRTTGVNQLGSLLRGFGLPVPPGQFFFLHCQ